MAVDGSDDLNRDGGAAAAAASDEAGVERPLARRAAARRVASFKEPTASDGEFHFFSMKPEGKR